MTASWRLAGMLLLALSIGSALLLASRVGSSERPPPSAPGPAPVVEKPARPPAPGDIQVPPPPFSPGVFPCSDCHNEDREPDPARRELSEHDFKFEHDAEQRWCLDCHNVTNYDKLRLASGEALDFSQSYRLCGQCHGDKYRDWRAGVHGRRTGQWDGQKTYLLCVHCHNPHSPRFRPLKPEPPPVAPEKQR